MTYLVDANVLSEPTKPTPDARVVDWLIANEDDFVVDSIILGEIYVGILTIPRSHRRTGLEQWFNEVVQTIDCLPWDAAAGIRWAQLVADLKKKGRMMPLLDSMIAASALEHDLTLATRNTRDFKKAGVKVFDPFS